MPSIIISSSREGVFQTVHGQADFDGAQRKIDEGRRGGAPAASKRFLYFGDPCFVHVIHITAAGLCHLEDPAAGEEALGFTNGISLDRFILFEHLAPQ